MENSVLNAAFYTRDDVVTIARELLGKVLCTAFNGELTSGIISETEAYAGVTDRASHAFNGRRTGRTEIMYRQGGTAYVYLCYGVHSLFNVVTSVADQPHAVLIRGIFPMDGKEVMERRRKRKLKSGDGIGPGNVSVLLGIHYSHSGLALYAEGAEKPAIWIEDRGLLVPGKDIITGPRVGVDYAGTDALLPYRFRIQQIREPEKK